MPRPSDAAGGAPPSGAPSPARPPNVTPVTRILAPRRAHNPLATLNRPAALRALSVLATATSALSPGTIEEAVEHLSSHGVEVEARPLGAKGPLGRDGRHVYFRDLLGSLGVRVVLVVEPSRFAKPF